MNADSMPNTRAARICGTRYYDSRELSVAAVTVLFLAVFTVWHQMEFMGLGWYETVQWERTQEVMRGESGTPWQYRLFTESIVTGTVRLCEYLGMERPVAVAFVAVRLVQNTLAFSLALVFFGLLGIPLRNALLGIGLLGWGMGHALYDGDLTFNTYTDMSIFLTAGSLIITKRFYWLIPLMCIAPFNRETSGCIPFMLLFSQLRWEKGRPVLDRQVLLIFLITLATWASIIAGLRLVYGVRPYIVPTAGVSPILPLLTYNLTWWRTWVFLFATMGILPLLALGSWKAWPQDLKRFFFAVAPVWFPLHFALAHAPETRLFLVPHVLLFVPGALLGLGYFVAERRS
jgi:hypothetical protein